MQQSIHPMQICSFSAYKVCSCSYLETQTLVGNCSSLNCRSIWKHCQAWAAYSLALCPPLSFTRSQRASLSSKSCMRSTSQTFMMRRCGEEALRVSDCLSGVVVEVSALIVGRGREEGGGHCSNHGQVLPGSWKMVLWRLSCHMTCVIVSVYCDWVKWWSWSVISESTRQNVWVRFFDRQFLSRFGSI